jgi:hypothetical protein
MAMTCHGMTCGLRMAIDDPREILPWQDTSTAWKSSAIREIEHLLRHPEHPPAGELLPDLRVERDLFLLIVGRMAAELR